MDGNTALKEQPILMEMLRTNIQYLNTFPMIQPIRKSPEIS